MNNIEPVWDCDNRNENSKVLARKLVSLTQAHWCIHIVFESWVYDFIHHFAFFPIGTVCLYGKGLYHHIVIDNAGFYGNVRTS